jgi:hypothetical protein
VLLTPGERTDVLVGWSGGGARLAQAFRVHGQTRARRIDAGPSEPRLGEQEIGPPSRQPIFQEPMRQDDVRGGHLVPATDGLGQETRLGSRSATTVRYRLSVLLF